MCKVEESEKVNGGWDFGERNKTREKHFPLLANYMESNQTIIAQFEWAI